MKKKPVLEKSRAARTLCFCELNNCGWFKVLVLFLFFFLSFFLSVQPWVKGNERKEEIKECLSLDKCTEPGGVRAAEGGKCAEQQYRGPTGETLI